MKKTMGILRAIRFGIILALVIMISGSCAKENPAKTSRLGIQLNTTKTPILKGLATYPAIVDSVKICIGNLIIEENSGNDVEQQGNVNDNQGGSDTEKNNASETVASDIVLPGPFVLDVNNGVANIGEASAYPGTFKKVDFTFLPDSNPAFYGNSLIIKGTYANAAGLSVPFMLQSAFNQQVQVPIAGGGVSVTQNQSVLISIVLDMQTWINELNFAGAQVVNGSILINITSNQDLLSQFEAALSKRIEADKSE